jgi:hypothetical protein
MSFVAISYISAALVIALATLGFVNAGGFLLLPFLILLFGLFLALVAVLDVPLRVVVDETGVERRCLLRHHRLAWDRVAAFTRSSSESGVRRYLRSKTGGARTAARSGNDDGKSGVATDREATKGGLVVEDVRRRRYLLSLGRERPDEYALLAEVTATYAPGLSMPGPPFYSKRAGRL